MCVCVGGGGGGGAHRHVIYVPSVKNQYKRVVFGEREINVLFNDALNTFYLRLYG